MAKLNTKYIAQNARLSECPRFDGAILAGGAVLSAFTGQDANDYDIYFKSRSAFEAAVEEAYASSMWCVSATKRSVTFLSNDGLPVQFMWFDWFDDAAAIFDKFDFTCCMAAYDFDAGKEGVEPFTLHSDFIHAAAERRLTFHGGTLFPLVSLLRVMKYTARGYTITRQQQLAIGMACSALSMKSWEDLKTQLGGVYGHHIEISEGGEFSVPAAIEAVTQSIIMTTVPESQKNQDKYGSCESLLAHLFTEGANQ